MREAGGWNQPPCLRAEPANPANVPRHSRQVMFDLTLEVMGRDITFVEFEGKRSIAYTFKAAN